MYRKSHPILQAVTHAVRRSTKRAATFTKLSVISMMLVGASFIPLIAVSGTAHADTNCGSVGVALNSSSWLTASGGAVNVCNHPGSNGNQCNTIPGAPGDSWCPAGQVFSGSQWQCVELANRLYLNKGWTTAWWKGNGGGSQGLINYLPSTLTDQLNGSISYINPGDAITLNNVNDSDGHVGIIDTVSGTTYNIVNQNAQLRSSAYIASGSLSSSNANLNMNAWLGYSVQAIVHHSTSTPQDNTVLQVKKITQSDGTNEVVWSKSTDVDESWWNGSTNGPQVANLIHIPQGDIKSFDIELYPDNKHDLFVATAHNIWEVWWYPGQGLHVSANPILANIGNIKKIIKSHGPDGVTNQLYVLKDTGAYEYYWNSSSNGIQGSAIMTLANPVDEYKEIEPDGTQALFIADQNYPYEQHWGTGITGFQQTTFSSFAGITSISFSKSSDNKHRLYVGSSSGAVWEASWYPNGSISYWYMTGGSPVVQLQKYEDDSQQVIYEATNGGVFEYSWPTTSNTLSSRTIVGSLSSVHAFIRSTDPNNVQSVYTATGTNILESWWPQGSNTITTGTIE